MRPEQCGNGRRGVTPGDRAAVREFEAFLRTRKAATNHRVAVQLIMAGLERPQLLPAPPYHRGDLVKVVSGPHTGRWGRVSAVEDYRHLHTVGRDNSHLMTFGLMITFYAKLPGRGLTPTHRPVGLEPHEVTPLHDGAGDWTKGGRVVSRRNWPAARTGESEAS